jgi:hypothetical protein
LDPSSILLRLFTIAILLWMQLGLPIG